jgi:hypothetical protein
MERYKNLGGDSNVVGYELGDGSLYEYTNASAGVAVIATMQRLAVSGQGLNSFISKTVRQAYSRKIR